MKNKNYLNILDISSNYGHYTCHIKEAMDKAGISISKMRKLTGLNHEIVKKYYEDKIIRIDKDVLSRITFILLSYGLDIKDLIEYVPPKK